MALGVYVHIPYCVTKCPYCDFNSYAVGDRFPEREYTNALLKELRFYSEELKGSKLTSVFFGGGTPSLFNPESIEKILSGIYEITLPHRDVEVTLEANPKTADLSKLKALRDVGINRISVGVQSFSQRKLSFLERINSPEDSRRMLKDLVRAGFDNFSLDIMYGVKGETLSELKEDLTHAVGFGAQHVSAYCLTVENGTAFGTLRKLGKLNLPDEDALSELIAFTMEFLGGKGYEQYEISNYARAGYECEHNLLYWRCGDYLGIGAGAHSHFSQTRDSEWGSRWADLKNPSLYMKSVRNSQKPIEFTEALSRGHSFEDRLLMGLRLKEGLDALELCSRYRASPQVDILEDLLDGGFIESSRNKLRLTKKGNLLADEIILRLVDAFN